MRAPSARRLNVVTRALASSALLFGLAVSAEPTCDDGVRLFPAPGATVPTNVQLVLEGLRREQDRVSALVGSTELSLRSADEAVPLVVEKGWVSTMNRVAIRLRPKRRLAPNTDYTLALGEVLPKVTVLHDGVVGDEVRWRTGPTADTTLPRFSARPAISEGFYRRTAEGLTRSLKLRAAVVDAGSTFALVTLVRARGVKTTQQYVVPVAEGAVVLGHDECTGSFGFDDGRAYRVTVELFDVAGNRAPKPASLEVSAPKPEAREERP